MIQVWYHANCYDGFGAAWAAYRKFGTDGATYHAVKYQEPLPEYSKEDTIYMLDFSVKREQMLEIKANCKELVVLDHHKTAEEECKDLDFCTFDMNRSGAMIAWDYFHPDSVDVPNLITMIQDRDLWKFQIVGSKEFHAYLCSQRMDFGVWDNINNGVEFCGIDWFGMGTILLEQKQAEVDKIVEKAWLEEIGGNMVAVVNATAHWSEIGNELWAKHPEVAYAAVFTVYEDHVAWSLRSNPNGNNFDVSAVASIKGGGGHRNAAGFRVPISEVIL
jgi:oligoribonuclease NrnB/cAMP/cGMP phosphodiesterase (DHH superfamily)